MRFGVLAERTTDAKLLRRGMDAQQCGGREGENGHTVRDLDDWTGRAYGRKRSLKTTASRVFFLFDESSNDGSVSTEFELRA